MVLLGLTSTGSLADPSIVADLDSNTTNGPDTLQVDIGDIVLVCVWITDSADSLVGFGVLISEPNGWGTTGICYGATLRTSGDRFSHPLDPDTLVWDPPRAISVAISVLSPGDVLLLEEQWDVWPYAIPMEWYGSPLPGPQQPNGVHEAIRLAVAYLINVIEPGGNGDDNMDSLE